ncbi:unnamed protein product [Symbiodinium natans]|uniref:Pentatricopeptide repeat-containing protein, chloroplastic n=1 Tax=Symbiodinium natans TaxID=878477 RepID=A0A812PSR9_9DINO|nr:unnamed protein product [Symbiodinium natans]
MARRPLQPRLSELPRRQDYRPGDTSDRPLKFSRVRLKDASAARLLELAEATPHWQVHVLPRKGHVVALAREEDRRDEVQWQMRPPPALRVLLTAGACGKDEYLQLLRCSSGRRQGPEEEDAAPSKEELLAFLRSGAAAAALPAAAAPRSCFPRIEFVASTVFLVAALPTEKTPRRNFCTFPVLRPRTWHSRLAYSDSGNSGRMLTCSSSAQRAREASAWTASLAVLAEAASLALRLDASCTNPAATAFEKGSRWRGALLAVAWAGRAAEILAYNALMTAAAATQSWRESALFLQELMQESLEPTIVSLSCAAAEPVSRAWLRGAGLLTHLRRFSVQCDVAAGNAVLSAATDATTWSFALATGSSLLHAGLELDLIGRNILIRGAGGAGWPKAMAQVRRMRQATLQPDVISYNAAITAAEAGGEWASAASMMASLSEGAAPSAITFNSAASAASSGLKWRLALRFFLAGFEAAKNARLVIGACQYALNWSQALEYLAKAFAMQLTVIVSARNAATMACTELPGSLQRDAVSFAAAAGACRQASFGAVIEGCTLQLAICEMAARWQHVLALRSLADSAGMEPELMLQNAAHCAWRAARRWEGSLLLLAEMEETTVQPDAVSFEAAVQTCELGGQPGPAALVLGLCHSRTWLLGRPT